MLRHIGGANLIKIKQFGLPRSGTNYVRYLIEENYRAKVIVDNEGWKHGYVSSRLPPERKCVIVCKNPFSWIVSAYNFYQASRDECVEMDVNSISKFIRFDFTLYHLKNLLAFRNPVQCWNDMNRHWLSITDTGRKLFIARHEDLLANAELVMEKMGRKFSLFRKNYTFIDTDKAFRPIHDAPIQLAKNSFRAEYYRKTKYMEKFSQKDLAFIRSELDREIMEKLDYDKLLV